MDAPTDAPLTGMTKAAAAKLTGIVYENTGVLLTFTGGLVVFEAGAETRVTKTMRELTVFGTFRLAANIAAGLAGAARENSRDSSGMDRHSHQKRAEARSRR